MKRLFTTFCVTLIVIFPFYSSTIHDLRVPAIDFAAIEAKKIRDKKAADIEHVFTNRFKKRVFNGTVLIAHKGKIIYKNALGYKNLRQKDSLNLNTAFQLASVSKPLTATAILVLYEKGLLSLDDPLQKFFPEFPYEGITIKLLLTHRSGLANYMYLADRVWPDKTIPMTNSDVVELLTKHKPRPYYPPDYKYNYSNTGYALLAAVVEKVSGKSFKRFMKEEIFEPLDMKNSFVYIEGESPASENKATGYTRWNRIAYRTYLDGVAGDKGIYSTVEDLLKFDQALYDEKLLSEETLKKAYTPLHDDLREDDNYGLGWRIDASDEDNKVVYHTGWWRGFRTYFIRKIDKEQTIIVLDNTTRGSFFNTKELRALL